ncbi:MAG: glycosyl hydrolase, partial [Clostridia bacterium]|nr:glycosyl hydrolase [Clostridia bacterium]
IKNVSDADFEALLGHPIPDGKWSGEITENDALCQLYYAKGAFARFLYRTLTSIKEKAEAKGEPNLNILFIYNMPIRAMAKFSNGIVSKKMTEDILVMVNGHFWRGLGKLLVDFFKNLSAISKFNKSLKAE